MDSLAKQSLLAAQVLNLIPTQKARERYVCMYHFKKKKTTSRYLLITDNSILQEFSSRKNCC